MTALEQKLIDELEALEADRNKKDESFKELKEQYEESIKRLSNSLALEYQESLRDLIQSENSEQESLIEYLKTLTQQNRQIIELLQKPPKSEDAGDTLKPILADFFDTLQKNLESSNKKLIEEIQRSTA